MRLFLAHGGSKQYAPVQLDCATTRMDGAAHGCEDNVRMTLGLLVLSMCAALAACATVTPLTQAGRNVQIQSTNSSLPPSCMKLGPITASGARFFDPENAARDARHRLREAAAALGADTVVLLSEHIEGLLTRPRVTLQGVALRCHDRRAR